MLLCREAQSCTSTQLESPGAGPGPAPFTQQNPLESRKKREAMVKTERFRQNAVAAVGTLQFQENLM